MASDAGGNNQPAGAGMQVADEMARIRDLVVRLERRLLPEELRGGDQEVRATFGDLWAALSRVFSLLDSGSWTLQEGQGPDAGGVLSPAGKRKFAQPAGDGNTRGGGRRRSETSSLKQVTSRTLNDGRTWRKYGQKDIQTHKHPRSYFRCTHRKDQGCNAIRQVQISEDDDSTYIITYMGEHTCKDPATVPRFASPSNLDHSHLISFATDATTTIPSPFQSIKKESDDDVLSNITYGGSSSDFCAQPAAEASTAISTPVAPAPPVSDHGDVSSGLLSRASNLDMDIMGDPDFDISILLDDFFQ